MSSSNRVARTRVASGETRNLREPAIAFNRFIAAQRDDANVGASYDHRRNRSWSLGGFNDCYFFFFSGKNDWFVGYGSTP